MIQSSVYLQEIKQCTTQLEANRVANQIMAPVAFESNSSAEGNSFRSPINVTWDIFYELLELEKKFNLSHNYSAYAAVILAKPKLSANWAKTAGVKKCTDFEDYLLDSYMAIATNIIPRWNKDVNDNFFAFLLPELRTVLNETAKPEIPIYVQKTYGRSLESFDAISENLGHEFEIADENTNVEKKVLNKIGKMEREIYYELVEYKEEGESTEEELKEQIKKALIVTQMFGGFSKELAERVCRALSNERQAAVVMER